MNKLIMSSVLLLQLQTSLASSNYHSINSWGTACPSNSLQNITFSPDNKSASIIFGVDSILSAPKSTTNSSSSISKECTIQAKYTAKYDVQYVVLSADWRGFASLVPNSTASTKVDTWISYTDSNGTLVNSTVNSQVSNLNGAHNDSTFFSSHTPEIMTSTECGQSFNLNTKVTASITNSNPSQDALLGFDTLDLAQVQEVPCANPWKAELKNAQDNSITVKVSTESTKVNKLGSLYVVASYLGKLYAWTPGKSSPWTELASDLSTGIPAIGTALAPSQFEFQIGNLDPAAKGAVVYVGVGYGSNESERLNDLLSTQRYSALYTLQ